MAKYRVPMPTPPHRRKRRSVESFIARNIKYRGWAVADIIDYDDGDREYQIARFDGTGLLKFSVFKSVYEKLPPVP